MSDCRFAVTRRHFVGLPGSAYEFQLRPTVADKRDTPEATALGVRDRGRRVRGTRRGINQGSASSIDSGRGAGRGRLRGLRDFLVLGLRPLRRLGCSGGLGMGGLLGHR
ncbi:MAG: hypothetical protein BGO79_27315 [Delftia sp. 67-8]|nr:MAG: hypothetical protein BGO79_27315 [Delftia sp. 67-8]